MREVDRSEDFDALQKFPAHHFIYTFINAELVQINSAAGHHLSSTPKDYEGAVVSVFIAYLVRWQKRL